MSFTFYDDFLFADKYKIYRKNNKFGNIYFNSNEDLPQLFNAFSVVDKNILSVAGSGDQYLWSRYKGAKNVDTYDINKLAIHYLYLRKWLLKYLGDYYLKADFFSIIRVVLPDILKHVECESESEQNSYNFWNMFLVQKSNLTFGDLFYFCNHSFSNSISDISSLKNIISSDTINFYEQDLSGKFNIDKKYDIVVASNILEHFCLDKSRIENCRDNLYSILNNNGEIICTYFLCGSSDVPVIFQKKIFSMKFEVRDLFSDDSKLPVGYSYIKK